MRSGVTPTDIMHLYGDYTEYDARASKLGVAYLQMTTDLRKMKYVTGYTIWSEAGFTETLFVF